MLGNAELGPTTPGRPAGASRKGGWDLSATTWTASGDGEEFFIFSARNPLKSSDSEK
jgi:hypothetical protein